MRAHVSTYLLLLLVVVVLLLVVVVLVLVGVVVLGVLLAVVVVVMSPSRHRSACEKPTLLQTHPLELFSCDHQDCGYHLCHSLDVVNHQHFRSRRRDDSASSKMTSQN